MVHAISVASIQLLWHPQTVHKQMAMDVVQQNLIYKVRWEAGFGPRAVVWDPIMGKTLYVIEPKIKVECGKEQSIYT